MVHFSIPRDLYFGEDALNQLSLLSAEKALIVIGSNRLIADGTVAKIQALLKQAGIASEVFSGIEQDPSIATVQQGVAAMNTYQPDLILGVGGGSPIDAAKAMWIFYEHPDFTFEEAAKPFNLPPLRQKARFVAIPTTSGTGTEVTAFSIITDHQTGVKYPIADYNITPDLAILDTNLVTGMPEELTAHTGMDALTHAIEAYVSTAANPITDALAIKAIEMVFEYLPASYQGVPLARTQMHLAQCIAGMAFSNAILGIVHSMSHKSSKIFGIPHGCANAIYLPGVIEYNAKAAGVKYADIAGRIGLTGNSEAELVTALVGAIKELRSQLTIPCSLKAYGYPEAGFLAEVDRIAREAVADPCTGTNPRAVTAIEMKQLFECAYYGNSVTF